MKNVENCRKIKKKPDWKRNCSKLIEFLSRTSDEVVRRIREREVIDVTEKNWSAKNCLAGKCVTSWTTWKLKADTVY